MASNLPGHSRFRVVCCREVFPLLLVLLRATVLCAFSQQRRGLHLWQTPAFPFRYGSTRSERKRSLRVYKLCPVLAFSCVLDRCCFRLLTFTSLRSFLFLS